MRMENEKIPGITKAQIAVYTNLRTLLVFYYIHFRKLYGLVLQPDVTIVDIPSPSKANDPNRIYFENMTILQACVVEITKAFLDLNCTYPEYKSVVDRKKKQWCYLIIRTDVKKDSHGYPLLTSEGVLTGAVERKEAYESFHNAMAVYVAFMFDTSKRYTENQSKS